MYTYEFSLCRVSFGMILNNNPYFYDWGVMKDVLLSPMETVVGTRATIFRIPGMIVFHGIGPLLAHRGNV
jgi:hypothetical protein